MRTILYAFRTANVAATKRLAGAFASVAATQITSERPVAIYAVNGSIDAGKSHFSDGIIDALVRGAKKLESAHYDHPFSERTVHAWRNEIMHRKKQQHRRWDLRFHSRENLFLPELPQMPERKFGGIELIENIEEIDSDLISGKISICFDGPAQLTNGRRIILIDVPCPARRHQEAHTKFVSSVRDLYLG